jgi:uncharacterized integral membrane protein
VSEQSTSPAPSEPAPRAQTPRNPNLATIIVGLFFLVIGVWYFLDTTLALAMPQISWGDLWPLILIVLGGVILFRAAADRRS